MKQKIRAAVCQNMIPKESSISWKDYLP